MIKFIFDKAFELVLKVALVALALVPAAATFDVAGIMYSGVAIQAIAGIIALTEDGWTLKIPALAAIGYTALFKFSALTAAFNAVVALV